MTSSRYVIDGGRKDFNRKLPSEGTIMDGLRTITAIKVASILVAGPPGLFRDSLATLADDTEHRVSGEANSFQAMLDHVQREPIDLILLDAALEDLNGPSGMRELSMMAADAKVIVIADGDTRETICEWLGAGARGYVSKSASLSQLRIAVDAVLAGGVYAPVSLCQQIKALRPSETERQPVSHFSGLTERQKQILALVMDGWDTNAIARRLDIGKATVRIHLLAIYRSSSAHGQARGGITALPGLERRLVLPAYG
jgi:DNA-binding NarL/FixJ family response regulator